ncbi:MAG: PQQ-binding-like beta-propeller repeat protein [Chloroflexi bacterium]|nr:PQQ-binding-like beta-propeller repeat protein [Chloroflexota bacterium]
MVNPKRVPHLLMVFTMLGLLLAACGSEQSNSVPTITPLAVITTAVATTQAPNTSTVTSILPTQAPNTSKATPIPPTQVATVTPIRPIATAPASTAQPIGGNSFSSLSDWWNVNHDASNTNYNPNEKVLTAANVSSLAKKWIMGTPSTYTLVWNGFVISSNSNGQLQSYEINTGEPAATYVGSNSEPFSTYIASEYLEPFAILSSGLLFLYTKQDKGRCLTSYDLLSGSLVSCVPHQGSDNNSVSQIVQANNLVLTSTFSEEKKDLVGYAFNAQNGQVKWSVKELGKTTPTDSRSANGGLAGDWEDWVVAGNLAILNTPTAIAYDLNSGREVWHKDLPYSDSLGRDIMAANGTVIVSARKSEFYAYDASTGNLKWSKTPDNAGSGRLLATNGTQVFVSTFNNTNMVYSLDLATGKVLWQQPLEALSSAALTNDLLFIAAGNNVYALQATTGKIVHKLDVTSKEEYPIQHLAVAEGHLIVTGFRVARLYEHWVAVYGLK